MPKVYARTNTVPDGCDYITPGKAYLVLRMSDTGAGFEWQSDTGDIEFAKWENSIHLDGGNWERIETDGEPPETIAPPSRYQHLTITELEADLSAIECALQAKREALAENAEAL